MTGLVDIFNRALSACGSEIGVTAPDENSREAALCRLWYPQVLDNVQATAPWAACKMQARLARIAERGTGVWTAGKPDSRYAYAYALPTGMLQPHYLDSYESFSMMLVGGQRALSCNHDQPILNYLQRNSDTAQWEPELTRAIVHTLAVHICIPLTGNAQRMQQNAQVAYGLVEEAKAMAANADHQPEENLPDWLTVRGYANPMAPRYYYPLQTLSVVSSA